MAMNAWGLGALPGMGQQVMQGQGALAPGGQTYPPVGAAPYPPVTGMLPSQGPHYGQQWQDRTAFQKFQPAANGNPFVPRVQAQAGSWQPQQQPWWQPVVASDPLKIYGMPSPGGMAQPGGQPQQPTLPPGFNASPMYGGGTPQSQPPFDPTGYANPGGSGMFSRMGAGPGRVF